MSLLGLWLGVITEGVTYRAKLIDFSLLHILRALQHVIISSVNSKQTSTVPLTCYQRTCVLCARSNNKHGQYKLL